jgi:hypothetical protein
MMSVIYFLLRIPAEKEYTLVIFKNSGYTVAWFFHDVDQDDSTSKLGVDRPINISGNFYDEELAYIVKQKFNLYNALSLGSISEGYWLCGEIINRRVKQYILNGKTAKYYTLPMLWEELCLTNEQKENRIIREFSWKGRPLANGTADDWIKEDEKEEMNKYKSSFWDNVTNADAFDDPSDCWNID